MAKQEPFTLKCGYHRNEDERTFRCMTITQAQQLAVGSTAYMRDINNCWRWVKVNGVPKTWKTRPYHVKVPLKYGMYEYFYDEVYAEKDFFMNHLLVEVNDG